MAFLLRRGLNSDRLTITPLEGEIIYTTDTKLVYVGDGVTVGGVEVGFVPAFTTSDIPEQGNLYYTDNRVYANVIGLLNGKANLTDLTTANIVEGSNLYYTDNRVYSNVIGLLNAKANVVDLTTSNIIEGSNLYFTNSRAVSSFTAGQNLNIAANGLITTTLNQVVQGNLTVQGNLLIMGNVAKIDVVNFSVTDNMIYLNSNSTIANPDIGFAANYNDGVYHHTGLFRSASDGRWKFFENYSPEPDASPYIDTNHVTFKLANVQASTFFGSGAGLTSIPSTSITGNVDSISEGVVNLYYKDSRVYANVKPLLNFKANVADLTTANVAELTNLYYTNTRVYSNVIGLLSSKVDTVSQTTANTTEVTNLYFTNARVYSNVIGLLNTKVTTANLTTSIIPEGTNLYYTDARVDTYFKPFLNTSYFVEGANLFYTSARVDAYVRPLLNTSYFVEGANLFYTNTRVYANVIPLLNLKANTADLNSSNIAEGTKLFYTDARVYSNVISLINAKVDTVSQTTANTTEVTNLYFTNARVYSNVIGLLNAKANTADLNSSNITEGNKLFYTDNRVYANVIGPLNSKANTADLTTANVLELTNLYFTNTRAIGAHTAGQNISIAANGLISGTVTSFTGNTNVVPEGSANLYYTNARVYANVIGLLNAKANTSDLNTSNVIEGSNLYFTNARVYANVIGLLNAKANTSDLNTSNVIEGSNLYFTNTRAIAAHTAGQNISIAANGLITGAVSAFSGNTNAVPEGSSNLYYTNSRVYANVIGLLNAKANTSDLTTANTAEVTNLYFTNARVYANVIGQLNSKANTADLNTNNVTEGTNLYFTNTRAIGAHTAGQNISIAANGLITGAVSAFSGNTNAVPEGSANLYFTNTRVYANVIGLLNAKANTSDLTTANTTEVTNLYFTNTRAIAAHTAGQNISIAANGLIGTTKDQTIGGNLTVQGNLLIMGNITTVSVSNFSVTDNMIYLNSNSTFANPDIGFAANYNDGTYHHTGLFRSAADGRWKFFDNYAPEPDANIYINTADASFRLANVQAGTFFGSGIGLTGIPATAFTGNTDSITEGVVNLYYTNTRVYSNVIGLLNTKVNNVSLTTANTTEVTNLYFTNTRAISALTSGQNISVAANGLITGAVSAFSGNTNFVPEGSANLYFTNARVYANVVPLLGTKANTSDLTTANTSEVTNLYFTNTRVYANVIGLLNAKANTADLTTANTTEVTNLYFTNTRVYANVVPLLGTKANTTDLTTANTTEVTNLYFTNARVYANVIGLLNAKANTADLNTGNIVEGANLYFTNVRAIGAHTAGQNISIAANGLITGTATAAFTGNTNAVPEGSANLYFTNTRSISALTSGQNISIAANGLITGASGTSFTGNTNAVPEGTANLYFTNTRAISSLTAGSGVSIAANGTITANVLTVLNSQSFPGGNASATLLTSVIHPKQILVTIDGMLLIPLIDYTVSGSTINFIGTPSANSTVEVKYYGNDAITVFNNNILSILTSQNFAGGASTITLATSVANPTQILVSIDGLLQIPTLDYTVSGNILTFITVPPVNSVIEVKYYGTDSVLRSYTPVVLNDISPYFDGISMVFNLIQDQDTINTIVDSKDLEVIIGGRRLAPYVKSLTYPWLATYDSFKGFKVSGSQIIIYSAPAIGTESSLIYRPVSTAKQTKKYPYSATTIALGD